MENYRDLEVFKCGEEIVDLTRALIASFDEEKDQFEMGQMMLENAYTITAKIANAEGGDLYGHRIDNATLIKLAAKELLAQCSLSRKLRLTDPAYLQLLIDELSHFRMHFLEWVASFNKENDVVDDWSFHHFH